MNQDGQKVLERVREEGVKIIHLWFSDIEGRLKSFSITEHQLPEGLEHGMGFDGSSITGYAEVHESDVIALPDARTFQLLPFESSSGVEARVFCDIYDPDGKHYPGDPRAALRRLLEECKQLGYVFNLGPELEYFYFQSAESPKPLDQAGYFDMTPDDLANKLRKETTEASQRMGIPVQACHHEVSASQHEIDLKYADALTMADAVMTVRWLVKEVAQRRGIFASFMPKPLFGVNGSGMHTHQSLMKDGKNAFFDKDGQYQLSNLAGHFIAGQLKHAREVSAVLAQWVNSYKRLVPGYEAPVYVSWGQRNRTALIRVPHVRKGREDAARAEMRMPDPACNPYLAFAVLLAVGMEGIRKKYPLPAPVEPNVYEMSTTEKESRGIDTLPDNLFEAVRVMASSELVRRALGEHIFARFIENKTREWDTYKAQVTSFEVEKYYGIL